MPSPQQSPSSSIKWNEVTWYSKLLAAIIFLIIIPALSFYIGQEYGKTQNVPIPLPAPKTNEVTVLRNLSYRDNEGWNVSYAYATDGNNIYFLNTQTWDISPKDLIKIGTDRDSFQVVFESLQYAWAKDKNTAYFFHLPIPGIDAATLEVPASEFNDLEEKNNYFKDKNHIYRLKENFDIHAHSDASQAFEIVR